MTTQPDSDLGDDLNITTINKRNRGGGAWVRGHLMGHRFDALVFEDHAEHPDYELGESRISKLWIQRESDRQTVFNFDRGWDVHPTTPEAAQVADFLAAGLAEHVFG